MMKKQVIIQNSPALGRSKLNDRQQNAVQQKSIITP